MSIFSQLPFEFILPEVRNAEPSVRVRIKSVKEKKEIIDPEEGPTEKIKSTRGRRPLKQLEVEAEQIEIPEDDILFQKQYYSIGDVAKMFRVNTSVIRSWENEFDIIEPKKNKKGDRHFRPVDIKNLQLIHQLIRKQKYTLEGAKDYIRKNKKAAERFAMIESLRKMRSFLLEVRANL